MNKLSKILIFFSTLLFLTLIILILFFLHFRSIFDNLYYNYKISSHIVTVLNRQLEDEISTWVNE